MSQLDAERCAKTAKVTLEVDESGRRLIESLAALLEQGDLNVLHRFVDRFGPRLKASDLFLVHTENQTTGGAGTCRIFFEPTEALRDFLATTGAGQGNCHVVKK